MSRAMRRCATAAMICLATATAARAQGLPDVPAGTVLTEVLMDAEGSEAQIYGALLGSTTSPQTLSGTSMTDLATNSFSFSLNPSSTYMGQSITDTVTGQYNPADGAYDYTSTGSTALGVGWQVSGTFVAAEVGIELGNVTWTIQSRERVAELLPFPAKPIYRVSDTVSITGPLGGPYLSVKTSNSFNRRHGRFGISFGTDTFDKMGNYKMDEGNFWKPSRGLPPGIIELAFQADTSGTTPISGGAGTYTATISSIPEPSSLIMALIGMGTALGIAMRRRSVNRKPAC